MQSIPDSPYLAELRARVINARHDVRVDAAKFAEMVEDLVRNARRAGHERFQDLVYGRQAAAEQDEIERAAEVAA